MSKKYTILYIDDEKENVENFYLSFYLKYNVITCTSALDAFEVLKKNEIQIIISDQRMPKMTGVEFFGQIKKEYPNIIRIILTGFTDESDVLNAINKGEVYRYITKPWKRQEVEITIENALESFRLKDENRALVQSLKEQNKALEEGEKRYRLLFETANDAILVLKDDIVIEANSITYEMFRCSEKDLMDQSISILFPPEQPDGSNSREMALRKLSMVGEDRQKVFEWQHKRLDGELFFSEVSLNLLILGDERYVLGIVRDITDRKNMEKKLLETIIQTEEKERMRFAQDLHDEVGPLLSSLKMYLSAINEIQDDLKRETFIGQCLSIITETIATVRRTSNALSPHILNNFGLKTAIDALLENTSRLININFETNIGPLRFNSNIEIVYYRILKELVNNTLKHASADNITIDLDFKEKHLCLIYKDDGIGFDFAKAIEKNAGGIGLHNILNRAKTIGSNFSFNQKLTQGVEFKLEIQTNSYG